MNEFWKNTMNCLLGVVLYHGKLPDEETWVKQYRPEIENMVEDIKCFHKSVESAGLEVSNEAMALFLIYSESNHIGNDYIVTSEKVDMDMLISLASQINDELT